MLLSDLPAPAKLNLFLHITGRRPDGYHLLQSVFVLIDWCDTLHLERRSDGQIRRHDLGQPLPPHDLCLRAAQALQAASGSNWGVDISIDKTLPWGAGMGGGSSNAATVLLGLNRLWGLNWPRSELARLALSLGADVPFFIQGDNAWVEGIGERIQPIELPPLCFAVLKPPTSLATAEIFSSPLLARDTEPATVAGFLGHILSEGNTSSAIERGEREWVCKGRKGPLVENLAIEEPETERPGAGLARHSGANLSGPFREWFWPHPGFGRNDLQAAAQALCPDVEVACTWMQQAFGNSRMTGSGSAVFSRIRAVPEKPDVMHNAGLATVLPGLPAGWVSRWCTRLAQHPLKGFATDEA
jgi:4-diphosphocytidyl-2-C-methyl-D-erythritol kinase